MLRIHLRTLQYSFARNRARRQMKFDPKLKNYLQNHELKMQIEQFRQNFQQSQFKAMNQNVITQKNTPIQINKFSEIVQQKDDKGKKGKNKLGQRFFINQTQINKKVKKIYKDQASLSNLQSHDGTDFDYLQSSKSHLHDQKAQIEFEQKFKQKIFKVKQTKRLLANKQKDYANYLKQKEDQQYKEYQVSKKKLNNNRIKHMMDFSRNNQQLQLLIESGFMNNPQNLKHLIEDMNQQYKQDQITQNRELITEHNNNVILAKDQNSLDIRQTNNKEIENGMLNKLSEIGPQQLQNIDKIKEFQQNYKSMSEKDKQSCKEDLQLLKRVKLYEDKLFLSRYEAINFRFKGRVGFDFYKQSQLVSYIKNQNILPSDLLLIYDQNKNSINKFKLPIITPRVLGNIYCKTSLYRYPQTDQNNKINMLNNKLFQKVQKQTFKNINKMSDEDFGSIVWSYAKNHENQMGILRPNVSQKINQVIYHQFRQRINQLDQPNLGLVLRSISKLPLMKNYNIDWTQIISYLQKKIHLIQDNYAMESIFHFFTVLPPSQKIIEITKQTLKRFNEYQWQQISTLNTFIYTTALIFKYENKNDITFKQQISKILIDQKNSLKKILPQSSINFLPQFLTVLRQSKSLQQLKQIVNLTKKLTVDNINQQKQIISQKNLVKIVWSHSLNDLVYHLSSKVSKYKHTPEQIAQIYNNLVRKLTSKLFIPHQVLPFNSNLYFVYHNLAKLTHTQVHVLQPLNIAKILQGLAIVNYKNQPLYDQLIEKILNILQKIDLHDKPVQQQFSLIPKIQKQQTLQIYTSIISCYGFQRRVTPIYYECIQKLLHPDNLDGLGLSSLPSNLILRIISIVLSLKDKHILEIIPNIDQILAKMLVKYVLPYEKIFISEQKCALVYCLMELQEEFDSEGISKIIDQNFMKQQQGDRLIKLLISLWKYKQQTNQDDIKRTENLLEQSQDKFNTFIQGDMLKNETGIGRALSYTQACKKIYELKVKQFGYLNVHKKHWRLQIPTQKQVLFLATYEHLASKLKPNGQQSIFLHGIWKVYKKIYQKKGWNVKIICTFLEG